MTNLSAKTLLYSDQLFQGAYIENATAQMLKYNKLDSYYWVSDGKAEIDFIFENDNIIYPLEIKSGTSSKKKSLQVYMQKYPTALALRGSPMNLEKQTKILNCPLYLLDRLKQILGV